MADPLHASAAGYDALAPWYEGLERIAFGSRLHRARTALLDALEPPSDILVIGDGDGRLLEEIVRRFTDSAITSVDFSRRMLAHQRRRVGSEVPLRYECGNLLTWDFGARRYSCIVAAFVLDCFTAPQLQQLVPRLAGALRPAGQLYYVDFAIPANQPARFRAQVWLAVMQSFFRWQTKHQPRRLLDPDSYFRAAGLKAFPRREQSFGLLTTRIYERVA